MHMPDATREIPVCQYKILQRIPVKWTMEFIISL
jgi:hypothetical protein